MSWTRRSFLGGSVATAGLPVFAGVNLFGAAAGSASNGTGVAPWEKSDGRASNEVFVRRAYIDFAGRIPTKVEAQGYVFSRDPERKKALVDDLLAAESFADYWSMRFCDVLRVKSEFPINLWPNAVYVYHRRIHSFVKNDEPWDRFARAVLLSTGSDFRDAEANFLRSTARRTPDGFAEIAALTFLGWEWNDLTEERRKELADYFAIGQCTPGVIAVNTATFVGQKLAGVAGGIVATLGMVFPPLIIISTLAEVIIRYAHLAWVQHAFAGIRVCVCVLIFNAVLKLGRSAIRDAWGWVIFAAVLAASLLLDLSPVLYVLAAGVAGAVIGAVRRRNAK